MKKEDHTGEPVLAYFLRVLNAKKEKEDWAKKIPLDQNVVLAHMGKIEHLIKYQKPESGSKQETVELDCEAEDLPI